MDILWCTQNKTDVITLVRREYYALLRTVTSGNNLNIMRVRASIAGQTGDYLNVVMLTDGSRRRVPVTQYNRMHMCFDTKYYKGLLISCVDRVVLAAGISDASVILSS